MQSLDAVHLVFPSPEHYGAALVVDTARWSADKTSDAEAAMVMNAMTMLTNPKRQPDVVIEGMRAAIRMLWVLEEALNPDPNAESPFGPDCHDPECPVHGVNGIAHGGPGYVAPKPSSPEPSTGLDLDGVFGADWSPEL